MFRRKRKSEDFGAEIEAHLALEIERLQREQGLTQEEARAAAHRAFGNVTRAQERFYEAGRWMWWEHFWQDLRFGGRLLRKSPGFTIVAILTLALGIGANTAIFTLVDGIVLRPLPYPDSERIVHFGWMDKTLIPNLSIPEFEFLRDHAKSFSALGGFQGYGTRQLNDRGRKRWITAADVTDGFFETMGVNMQVGRPFERAFTRPGGAYGAVLADSLWRSAFGADPNIVGRQIILDGQSYTVTGVLPPGFTYLAPADAYASLHTDKNPGNGGLNTDVMGRFRRGVSLAEAQAEARLLGAEFFAQAPVEERQGAGVLHLDRYREYLASDYRTNLLILLSAVGLLLLIACANVASLLLARATARQKEISIRLALGAGRGRLLEQFLAEGLLLGGIGAAAGLATAGASLRVFVAAIPWDLPSMDRFGLDGRVLLFTSLVAIVASVAFGLASFFQTRKVDLNSTLKEGRSAAEPGRGGARLLNALVAGEVAISLVLALGAGLLVESLYNLYQQDLGFNPAHLMVMQTPFAANASGAGIWNFEREALARIQAIPGVQSVAIVSVAPLHGRMNLPAQRDGHPEDSIGGTELRTISSNYFSTMEIPFLRGRGFEQSDIGASAPVAIINETLARDWWPGQNPIGDHVVLGEYQGRQYIQIPQAAREIIGIVADTKGMLLDRPAPPMIYLPMSEGSFTFNGSTDWVVRAGAPAGIAPALRKAIADVAPEQRILDLQPMRQLVSGSVAQPNFEALLVSTFGSLALILTLVGVYGVFSFQVAQRRHEIGMRVALGASPRQIWRLIIGKAAALAAAGVLMGLLAALGLTRLMKSLLFGVQPADLATLAPLVILVMVVALLAAYVPARRAMKVDPMVALRHE